MTERSARFAGLVLVLLTLAVHGRSVTFDFVNWDDDAFVLGNTLVTDPASHSFADQLLTPAFGYAIPVTNLSFHLNYALGGMEPAGYHALNILLHALTVLGLFAVLRGLRVGVAAAAGCAALFALHPMNVEPVSWVTGRKDLLAAALAILSVWFLIRARATGSRSRLIGSGCLCVLALFSKPSVVGLGLILLAVDHLALKTPVRRSLRFAGPLVLASVAVAALTTYLESEVGALGAVSHAGRLDRVAYITLTQLRHVLLPVGLLPKYIQSAEALAAGASATDILLTMTLFALLVGLVVWPRTRSRLVGIGALWVIVSWLPVSGLVALNREVADSYLYMPLLGAALMLADFASVVAEKGMEAATAVTLIGSLVLLSYGGMTLVGQQRWQNGLVLWQTTFETYPDSPQVCRSIGNAYLFGRDYERAPRERTEEAARTYGACYDRFGRPEMFMKNMGIALFRLGDLRRSSAAFDRYLEARPGDPTVLRYLDEIDRARSSGVQ